MSNFQPPYSMATLTAIMAKLRTPDEGCPWDLEQSFESIAPYTIEEAYEVDDAIRSGNREALADELGDLLFQAVFHARMAEEEGSFTFDDVVAAVCDKMIRRHPHVFAGGSIDDGDAQISAWEAQKAEERRAKAAAEGRHPSVLDEVALGLPALMRAEKLQKRAARVGFDWNDAAAVQAKINEERAELAAAVASGDQEAIDEEFGDLLFAVANLGRHLKVDPEAALRSANAKFERRFRAVEAHFSDSDQPLDKASLEDMEAVWREVKRRENPSGA